MGVISRKLGYLLALGVTVATLTRPVATETVGQPGNPIWAAQIDFTKAHDQPWNTADFVVLAQSGINRIEINLNWADIEPGKGQFHFPLLDTYLDAAAQAHVKLILIFWESVWGEQKGKNPPAWITSRDVTSDGIAAQQPPWWDADAKQSYFDYVARVIDHCQKKDGFGGLFANYGWLDAMWGPVPKGSHGVTGYASADRKEFHRWLAEENGSIATFNRKRNTKFADWEQVPAARPGQPLFDLYQHFRNYSVEATYNDLSKLVRSHTDAPLFYYWGGGLTGRGGSAVLGNDPDLFFRAAKKWNATVVLDDADHGGLALLFGSMARAYQVPLLQEWTPRPTGLRGETPEWLGHIGLSAPFGTGEDFFIYPPPQDKPGFPQAFTAYKEWRNVLSRIGGTSPRQPVAILVPTRAIVLNENLDAFKNLSDELKNFWRRHLVLPYFITDQEVINRVVDLSMFRAVVDLGDISPHLPQLQTFSHEHPVLHRLDEALSYLTPYAALDPPSDQIEVTPTVDGANLWLAIANTSETKSYLGSLTLDFAAMHLKAAGYGATDARSLANVSLRRVGAKGVLKLVLQPAELQVLELKPSPQGKNQ